MNIESTKSGWGIEAFGWYGAAATIAAYAFVSFGVLSPTAVSYQVLNLTGAAGLVAIALRKKDYPLVVVNAIWAVFAAVALVEIALHLI